MDSKLIENDAKEQGLTLKPVISAIHINIITKMQQNKRNPITLLGFEKGFLSKKPKKYSNMDEDIE